MRLFSFAFFVGILFLQFFSRLPSQRELGCIATIVIIVFVFFMLIILKIRQKVLLFKNQLSKRMLHQLYIIFFGFFIGFSWCVMYAYHQMAWTLPENFESQALESTGYIASIPTTIDHLTSFIFLVEKLKKNQLIYSKSGLIHLTFHTYEPTQLHVGDKWRFYIKLKKIHSTQNPGGFDYEAHALQQGIRASGYVLPKKAHIKLENIKFRYYIQHLREIIKNNILHHLPQSETSAWITALVVGEREGISQEKWEVLRKTGTNHLMAIAGLHIGFMSGFIYWVVNYLWRFCPRLMMYVPAQLAASIGALILGIVYSALAGFSLPTQRACIMLTVFLTTGLVSRKTFSWQAYSIALFLVLLINPLSILTESFWLSFGAVALIIYGVSARLSPKGLWWKWGRIQWLTAIGLIPICFALYQQASIISFLANAIAIPWVGFVIVPLSLFGSLFLFISAKCGGALLTLADFNLHYLWQVLSTLAKLSLANWYQVIPDYRYLIFGIIGVVLLLAPIGFPGRWFGMIFLTLLLNFRAVSPKQGEMWLTLLDVGQGLSAVVQTQRHLLIFDAGPKLNANFDMGETVVVPFIRTTGRHKINMLVVSHGDNDHIGGVGAILKHFIVDQVKTSVPTKIPFSSVSYCLSGQHWIWDGIKFEFLYPGIETLNRGNNSSCVLRISNSIYQMILPGDIEKYAEKRLLLRAPNNLPATILVAPHHGSKTSGLKQFIEKVHPAYVLFPIGYRNRFHFPHASVVEKYQLINAKMLDTEKAGAISFQINDEIKVLTYRNEHHRYWYSN